MGMGNAFAALTGGFFDGVEKRHAWEDRAAKQERQKKLDAYYDEEFGWKREENQRNATRFGWEGQQHQREAERHRTIMDEAADADRARDLVYADDQAVREATAKDLAAPAAPAGPALGARPRVADEAPQPQIAAPAGQAVVAAPAIEAAAPAPEAGQTAQPPAVEPLGARPRPAPDAATVQPAPAGPSLGARPPAAAAPASAPDAPPDWKAIHARGRDAYMADERVQAYAKDRGTTPALMWDFVARQAGAGGDGLRILDDGTVIPPKGRSLTAEESAVVAKAAKEGKLRENEASANAHAEANARASAGMRGDAQAHSLAGDVKEITGEITRTGRMFGDMVTGVAERGANAMRRADGYILGRDPVGIREVDDRATGALMDTAGRGLDRLLGALGAKPGAAAEKPAEKQAAATAAAALTDTPSGQAVAAVAETTVKGMGVNPAMRHPEKVRDKVADRFTQHFGDTLMPNTVKALLAQGRFDEAQKLQEWSDTAGAKAGLRAWAKAGMAAAVGDERGFIKNTAEAYNTAGYFDDGYQIIPEKSGFRRTEAGDIGGAYVTFKDEQTGQEFTQEFEGADDLIQMGVQMLSPEAILEHQVEQQKAQQEAMLKVAEQAQAKAKALEARVDDVAKAIFDAAAKNAMPGQQALTYAEARAQAEEQLGGGGGAGGAFMARVAD